MKEMYQMKAQHLPIALVNLKDETITARDLFTGEVAEGPARNVIEWATNLDIAFEHQCEFKIRMELI